VVKVASGNTATPTGHNADGNQAATANPDTGSITSGAGDTVVTYFVYNPTGGTFTAPTGYTQSGLTATIEIGPGDLKAAWAYQDSAAGGTINPTATTGSSVALSGGSIASMPVSGGGLAFGQDKVKTKLQAVSRSALWCQAFRRHGKSGIFLPDGIWTPQAA
jgi:hypothetical protein